MGTGEVTSGNTSQSFRMAHRTFRNYLEDGEVILTAQAVAGLPIKVEREYRSFCDMPENFAVGA